MAFFHEYFLQPIMSNGWFNPINTIVYGIILLIGVYLVYQLLKKLDIKIDWRFLLAILPFILWATTTRALRDFIYKGIDQPLYPNFQVSFLSNISTIQEHAYTYLKSILPIPGFIEFYSTVIAWFATPGSYLITFFVALVTLLISIGIQKQFKFSYWKFMFIIGVILCALSLFALPIKTLSPLLLILPLAIGTTCIFLVISKILKLKPFEKFTKLRKAFNYSNSGILGTHLLDAAATFTALTYFGYVEQHVLPRFMFSIFGPASFFILKIIVIIPILYIISNYTESERFGNFLRICIIILGLSPGLRDAITLLI